ncbi:hypothetical protein Tco_1427670 [Tanacetum coccineum]
MSMDRRENLNAQSTPQVPPSFKEYTLPVTCPKEVEKTLGTLIEVEPLNKTKLEDVGLICDHNTPLSSKEVPIFDGPEPQPLLNSPSLDVSLGDVIGPEPPIKPHSPDNSRMKVVRPNLTTQTHSLHPHVATFPSYRDDWGLEFNGKFIPLGEELSLFDRPNEVERKAHLLEDKQIPSVGVFDKVFLIWRRLGKEVRGLWVIFGERRGRDTDLTTNIAQDISIQWLKRHIRGPIWYLDSGCSRSMTGAKSYLHKYVEQPGPKVVFGDNSSYITEGYGSIKRGGIIFSKLTKETDVPEVIAPNEQDTPHTEDVEGPPDLINTEGTQEQISQITHQASTSSYPIAQDIWSRDQHIGLVNIIRDPSKGMLTRSLAAKLTTASASECLFADFQEKCNVSPVLRNSFHTGHIVLSFLL